MYSRSRFRLERVSGSSYANHFVYVGGVVPQWNSSLSLSVDTPDTYIYDCNFIDSFTGSQRRQESVPANCGYYDYASCGPDWAGDSRVFFFGGYGGLGPASTVWYYDPTLTGAVRTGIHSNMTAARVNPHVVAFSFQYLTSTLSGSWMVFGDNYDAEFFVTNPGSGSSNAFNRWLPVTGGLQGFHVQGAAVKYPNRPAILLVGGSGTNQAGLPQTLATERMSLSASVVDLGSGYYTLSFGSAKLPSGGQLMTERHSFAHGVDQLGRLWVVGGLSSVGDVPLSSSEIFDFTTETWSSGPSLPHPIAHARMIVNTISGSDELVILGGLDDLNQPQNGYTIRVMDTGSGWTALTSQINQSRSRGHRVSQIDSGRIFVVGGQIRTSNGGWVTDPLAIEEISVVSGATSPSFVSGISDVLISTDGLRLYSDGTRGLNFLPLRGFTFSKVTFDRATSQSFDALHDVGGLQNPRVSPVTGTLVNVSEVSDNGRVLYLTFPRDFVMNGCTASFLNPGGVPFTQVIDYLVPDISGNQLPVITVTGGITSPVTLTWSGWNLDHAVSASFFDMLTYGNDVRFNVPVTAGAFQTIFSTPDPPTAVAFDTSGNPYWLRQGVTHSITVDYAAGNPVRTQQFLVPGPTPPTWITPNLGPRPHYQKNMYGVQDVRHQWLLNETTATLQDSIGGGTINTSGYPAYAGVLYNPSIFYGSNARVIPTSSANGFPSLLYPGTPAGPWRDMLLTLGTANLTIEFWYYVGAGMGGPTSSWQDHVGRNPFVLAWDPGTSTRVYPIDSGDGNRDVSNLSFLELGISGNLAGHYDTGLYLKWEIGNRFSLSGTLYGPTVVVAQTTAIPPLNSIDKHHVVIERNGGDQNAVSVWIDNVFKGKWYPTIAAQYVASDVGVSNVIFNHFGPADGYTISRLPSQFTNPAIPGQLAGGSGSFYFGYLGAAVSDLTISNVLRNTNDINRSFYQGRGVFF